eukprot:COSAG03_NODE_10933_length_621_cov_0.660920_1_plen_128_part_10
MRRPPTAVEGTRALPLMTQGWRWPRRPVEHADCLFCERLNESPWPRPSLASSALSTVAELESLRPAASRWLPPLSRAHDLLPSLPPPPLPSSPTNASGHCRSLAGAFCALSDVKEMTDAEMVIESHLI